MNIFVNIPLQNSNAYPFKRKEIGLATDQRVVTIHRGRIMAESTVSEGAAFNFTLMKRQNGE